MLELDLPCGIVVGLANTLLNRGFVSMANPVIVARTLPTGQLFQVESIVLHFPTMLNEAVPEFRALESGIVRLSAKLEGEAVGISEDRFNDLVIEEVENISPLFRQAVHGTQNLMRRILERQAQLDPKPTGDPALRIEIRQYYLGISTRDAMERALGRSGFDELEAVLERIELFGWPPEVIERIRDKYRLLNEIRIHKIHVPLKPSLDKIAVVGSDHNAELAQARARIGQITTGRETAKLAETVLQNVVRLVAGMTRKELAAAFAILHPE